MSGQYTTTFLPQEPPPSCPRSGGSQQSRLPPGTESRHPAPQHLRVQAGENPFPRGKGRVVQPQVRRRVWDTTEQPEARGIWSMLHSAH